MRSIFCYIVIILIALQSVNAIAMINADHQDSHQDSHLQNTVHPHQDSDHHSEQELILLQAEILDGESTHSDADHPDCHSNHCHHSNLVYLDLFSAVPLLNSIDKQVITKTVLFNSLPLSPDSRPPIV